MSSEEVKLTSLQISLGKFDRNEISNRSEFCMQAVNAHSEINLHRIILVNN